MSKCRFCPADLRFIKTKSTGSSMPCESTELSPDELTDGDMVCSEYGDVFRYSEDKHSDYPYAMFLVHFPHCPGADEARSKRKDVNG